jgi:hypothetical protein
MSASSTNKSYKDRVQTQENDKNRNRPERLAVGPATRMATLTMTRSIPEVSGGRFRMSRHPLRLLDGGDASGSGCGCDAIEEGHPSCFSRRSTAAAVFASARLLACDPCSLMTLTRKPAPALAALGCTICKELRVASPAAAAMWQCARRPNCTRSQRRILPLVRKATPKPACRIEKFNLVGCARTSRTFEF